MSVSVECVCARVRACVRVYVGGVCTHACVRAPVRM